MPDDLRSPDYHDEIISLAAPAGSFCLLELHRPDT